MQNQNISTQQRLKELKASTGFSDQKLGELVGLDQSNVWRLRNGQYKKTTYEVGIRIAQLHSEIVIQKDKVSQ